MTPEVADHKKLEEILIEMKNRRVFRADVAEMLLSLEFFRARRPAWPDDDSSSTFLDLQLRASGEASDGVWQEFILQWNILPGVTEHLEQVRRSDDLLRAPRTWFLILFVCICHQHDNRVVLMANTDEKEILV